MLQLRILTGCKFAYQIIGCCTCTLAVLQLRILTGCKFAYQIIGCCTCTLAVLQLRIYTYRLQICISNHRVLYMYISSAPATYTYRLQICISNHRVLYMYISSAPATYTYRLQICISNHRVLYMYISSAPATYTYRLQICISNHRVLYMYISSGPAILFCLQAANFPCVFRITLCIYLSFEVMYCRTLWSPGLLLLMCFSYHIRILVFMHSHSVYSHL